MSFPFLFISLFHLLIFWVLYELWISVLCQENSWQNFYCEACYFALLIKFFKINLLYLTQYHLWIFITRNFLSSLFYDLILSNFLLHFLSFGVGVEGCALNYACAAYLCEYEFDEPLFLQCTLLGFYKFIISAHFSTSNIIVMHVTSFETVQYILNILFCSLINIVLCIYYSFLLYDTNFFHFLSI